MTLIETKIMDCVQITNLTEKQVKDIATEVLTIKDHTVYFVPLMNHFGFSALVFHSSKHIYYADEYELHYGFCKDKGREFIRNKMIEKLNAKLFTEAELMEDVKDYDEEERKEHFVRNFFSMRFEHESIFGINKELEHKNWLYCHTCFCYTPSQELVEKSEKYLKHIRDSYTQLCNKDDKVFRAMVLHEMYNHECGLTYDMSSALDALGIDMNKLSERRKAIVLDAFHECCEKTAC